MDLIVQKTRRLVKNIGPSCKGPCNWRAYCGEWDEAGEELDLDVRLVWGTLFSSFDRMYWVMSSCQERPAVKPRM